MDNTKLSIPSTIRNNELIKKYNLLLMHDITHEKDDDNVANIGKIPVKIAVEISYIHPSLPIKVDRHNTFTYNGYGSDYDSIRSKYQEKLDTIKKIVDSKKIDYYDFSLDSGSFEISSKPYTKLYDLFKWFLQVDTIMKENGFVTHSTKTDNGGLHFHIDIMDFIGCMKDIITFCRIPYLNWIFNNPVDNISANNYVTEFNKTFTIKKNVESYYYAFMEIAYSQINSNAKNVLLTIQNGNRLEFRFFDMARNFDEFILQTNFILRLYDNFFSTIQFTTTKDNNYNYSNLDIMVTYKDLLSINKLQQNHVISMFKNLNKRLGIDYNDYKLFVNRNLKTRYSYGKQYLT